MRTVVLLAFAVMVAGWGPCQGDKKMASLEAKWSELRTSATPAEEARRVEELAALAREQRVRYQVSLFDAATGAPVPIAELAREGLPRVRVELTIEGKDKPTLSWEPRSSTNIYPLLRE
jgi:hypothetical protein